MAADSSLVAGPAATDVLPCVTGLGFYRCGNFMGCCSADPCPYMNEPSPCDSATTRENGGGGNHGGGGGDGGGGGGGGDDDDDSTTTTTVTKTTSTRMVTSTRTTRSNSDSTSVSSETETSTADDDKPTSSSSEESSVPTDLPAASTTSAAIATDPTEGATATSDTLPAPTSTTPSLSDGGNAPMSKTTILSISVGGAVGGIALFALLFWLIRRYHLSKRMSSERGNSPNPGKQSSLDRPASLTGTALGSEDIFAEFGGRVRSHDDKSVRPDVSPISTAIRNDESWPLNVTPSPQGAHHQHQQSNEMSGDQSYPVELDSTEIGRNDNLSISAVQPTQPPLPGHGTVHPSPLTPGYPGTQMDIQHGSGRNGNFNRRVNIGQNQNPNPSYHAHNQIHQSRYQNYRDQNHHYPTQRNVANGRQDVPRATLSATDDERRNNLYANSWAYGP